MLKFERIAGDISSEMRGSDGMKIRVGTAGGSFRPVKDLNFKEAGYIVLELTALTDKELDMHLDFHDRTQKNVLRCTVGVIPANRIRIYFDLQYLSSQVVFLPRTPGKLKSVVRGQPMRKEDVKDFTIGFENYYKQQEFILHDVYVTQEMPDCRIENPVSIVDELGQLKLADWSEKTRSVEEMKAYMKNRISELDKFEQLEHTEQPEQSEQSEKPEQLEQPGKSGNPECTGKPVNHADRQAAGYGYSTFGGYLAKRFEAAGYFRLEQEGERWWMVDPEGYAFFSTGLDCVRSTVDERVEGIEQLYDWLPAGKDGEFADACSEGRGGALNTGTFFDFYRANLIRAFGENWWEAWARMTKANLLDWGFNTIANWSEPKFIKWAEMPYVYPLANFPSTEKRIFRDFPDVFSEEYRAESVKFAQQLKEFRGDPYLIGYFMRNEPLWGFAENINLAKEMFRSGYPFKTREVFIDCLKVKYSGSIQALSEAWRMELSSFQDISALKYETFSDEADKDLFEFSAVMAREYIRVPAVELKKVDPDHLNLGMRYAWISTELMFEGSEFFDVFSINCYRMKPDRDEIAHIYAKTGKPCMIGEYHFGAPDQGLLGAGLRTVATQKDRGKAFRYYVEQGAAIPQLIGVHYFTLNDEPALGRSDGEAWQIGCVDVCQKPYAEFISGVVETHRNLYAVLTGGKEPSSELAHEIPKLGN